jgi:hypothetical protein
MSDILNQITQSHQLAQLTQKSDFVGWVYSIDYQNAFIVTNDEWKSKVKGIPHNSFLVATSFDPDKFSTTPEEEREVILLRVIGSCKLPQDDDMIRTKIDNFQNQTSVYLENPDKDFDKITKNKIQFGGLNCRVLGTFYMKDNVLNLGSDIESYSVSMRLGVHIPKGTALQTIVNYVDPIRQKRAVDDFKDLGITCEVKPFKIGTVRYTSTDRLHRANEEVKVPFYIQPSDFLARRTAVLGMTRTGKSNMIKQTVSVVKDISDTCNLKIGQLIYDINGEYANANQQDNGSISDIFNESCIRYRLIPTEGFEQILNNFYIQLQEGHSVICELIRENKKDGAADIDSFMGLSFEEPAPDEFNEKAKWDVKVALYRTLLCAAGYQLNGNFKIFFKANQKVREKVNEVLNEGKEGENIIDVDPKNGFDYNCAKEWFLAARKANKLGKTIGLLKSSGGDDWLDSGCRAMLNMLAQANDNDSYIRGYRIIEVGKDYHTSSKKTETTIDIYNHLINGKIVILDLSVGSALIRDRVSKKIASFIFNNSMNKFTRGEVPPNIVVYIEEAHNLIGKGMELTETWPRMAKEGAKYKIALVYATQEVSSVHANILANTENWFVSHLNSEREIKELARFYDFGDFSQSLLRSQDVGFTRVKTLSSPFVVPIQIDKFDPEAIKTKQAR